MALKNGGRDPIFLVDIYHSSSFCLKAGKPSVHCNVGMGQD